MHNVQMPYIKPDRVCSTEIIVHQPNPSPTYLELYKTESYLQFIYTPPASIEVIYVISFLPKNVRRIWHKLREYLSFPHSTIYGSRSGGLGSPGDSVFFKTSWQMGSSWRVGGGGVAYFNGSWSPPVSQTILLLVLRGGATYYRLGLHLSEAGWFQDPKFSNWVHFAISPFLGPVML